MAVIKDLGAVSAYALAVEGGYTGTQEEFEQLMASYATVAQQAKQSAEDAEAYAIGKRDGTDVDSSDPAYHNNAAYYAGQASDSATGAASARDDAVSAKNDAADAKDLAVGAKNDAVSARGDAVSAKEAAVSAKNDAADAKTAAETAQGKAEDAQAAAETAQGKAEDAQESAEAAQAAAEAAAAVFVVDDAMDDTSENPVQNKVIAGELGDLKSQISYIEKFTGKKQTNTYTTSAAAILLLRAPLTVYAGQTVTVNATYTGSNASAYDIRFYDPDGQIHVISSSQPFGTDYTFTAQEDYAEISLYNTLSAAESGETFTSVTTVIGTLETDVEGVQTDLTGVHGDIEKIESALSGFHKGNLMPDLDEWIVGRVYQGVYSDAITTVKCTDYIPVQGGKTYYIYGGFISEDYFGVYDATKAVLSSWSFTSLTVKSDNTATAVITLPATARYIRLDLLTGAISSFPSNAYIGLSPNCLPKALDLSDLVPRIKGNGTLSDKKILVVGDSISTDAYGNYKKWVTFLCESGFFSEGFVTNNSYHATGYVAVYSEGGTVVQDTFINRVTALGDLSGYDMIVTFGGINDWIQSINFDTFKAAVDAYYAYLIEHATQARICVLSPLKTSLYGTTNSVGKTQAEYDDYIKSVAADYGFPVLNLTDESGFCPEKSNTFRDMWTFLPTGFTAHDGVHPVEGWERKYLAPQIAWFLAGVI